MILQLIFLIILAAAIYLFARNAGKIRRNILLGRDENRSDNPSLRLKTMLLVAFGQTKMTKRPIAAILHFFVYAGFIIINIEVLEILIDGLFGSHRVFSKPLGSFYGLLIGGFEWLALLVLVSCVVFLVRRNILNLKRFRGIEMKAWPRSDANYILIIEILLMAAFLKMNAADYKLQLLQYGHYVQAGSFPISSLLIAPLLPNSAQALLVIERICWWFHIVGILAFLNYLPYSKHFHILLAFPNTYYSNLNPQGKFSNMASVTNEVKAMLDPSYTPDDTPPARFGAKDATDLTWKNLMDAYTCTECGRCTSVCPANQTGKLLSPRKIMMDTRDRITEIGKGIEKEGKEYTDDKTLLDNYITREELWACTTCNACVEACPVNINPLDIINQMRRYIVMEESQAPGSLNNMFGNMENNGAPWKYSNADRFNWAEKK